MACPHLSPCCRCPSAAWKELDSLINQLALYIVFTTQHRTNHTHTIHPHARKLNQQHICRCLCRLLAAGFKETENRKFIFHGVSKENPALFAYWSQSEMSNFPLIQLHYCQPTVTFLIAAVVPSSVRQLSPGNVQIVHLYCTWLNHNQLLVQKMLLSSSKYKNVYKFQ